MFLKKMHPRTILTETTLQIMNTGIVILKYKYYSYILYSQFSLSLFSSYYIYIYIFFLIYYNFKCVFMLKKAFFFIEKGKKVVKSGVKNPAIFALMLINVKTPGNSDVNVTYGLRTDGLSAFLLSWNVLSMITYWPVVNVPFRSVPRSRLSRLIYRYPWYFLFRKRSYRQKSSRNSFPTHI